MEGIVRKAFSRRHANAAILHKAGLSLSAKGLGTGGLGTGQEATGTFESSIPDSTVHWLELDEHNAETVGLVFDYPVRHKIPHLPDAKCGGVYCIPL